MARIRCESCKEWMFEGAVTCPHCGKRQESRDPMRRQTPMAEQAERELENFVHPKKPKPTSVSKEEARALIQFADAQRSGPVLEDSRGGVASWILMPQLSGRARTAEIVLTVLCFPVIALLFFFMAALSVRKPWLSSRGLARVGAPSAAFFLFGLAILFGLGTILSAALVIGMLLCWIAREILRARARPRLDV